MLFFANSKPSKARDRLFGTLLSLLLLAAPTSVLAHAGHGDEFHGETEASQGTPQGIQVDAQTAKRMGIEVKPVSQQRLDFGIKTTGQIETLPSQKAEVTSPTPGKIVELLVEPGAVVQAGKVVAVIAAPDLVELRVGSQEKRAEAEADLQQAQADLKLAQENYQQYSQIAASDIQQARTELAVAQEQYERDRELERAGALPRRQMLESLAHLAEAKTQLTKATSRREVLEAEAQLKRAQSAVKVANSRIRLSNTAYQTRLQQLGTRANDKGLVTVTAPISGTVADREITLGQSVEEAGAKLMTILNNKRVWATANIYEKDLNKVKIGQRVNVKVASLPNRTFTGKIAVIGSVVEGETRVVPVKAELDNPGGQLKPGMFAELEVLTNQTPAPILVIPTSAVVETNGRQRVYVQNGTAFEPVEVTLGRTVGDVVEVKGSLFEGDRIVTQGAIQLYAQSLRGDSSEGKSEEKQPLTPNSEAINRVSAIHNSLPWLWVLPAGGAIAFVAFWLGRRTQSRKVPKTIEALPAIPLPHESEIVNDSASKQEKVKSQ
ncbi:efflux RND transporter periplasmic adaptor subunit [Coleofasciculus sp. FACHB-712]|uniref:efflux RND transporter periplasmic adaptor subunit n=1 Tax=Coleofasciculus sp. FACHB-712 TaxID=2692789 RepID=UPI0016884A32|nr:efflux RND transporter periplasmic adaptor subunit [Coleofasciculus sp. FACHB-712]MBD1943262.1 efflux RND transporter periplasmic adaptor subunit [Coleofasciculus sp. FACHB-712]